MAVRVKRVNNWGEGPTLTHTPRDQGDNRPCLTGPAHCPYTLHAVRVKLLLPTACVRVKLLSNNMPGQGQVQQLLACLPAPLTCRRR